jgi:hypothetical protein
VRFLDTFSDTWLSLSRAKEEFREELMLFDDLALTRVLLRSALAPDGGRGAADTLIVLGNT